MLQDAGLFGIIPDWKFLKLKALDLSSFYVGNYELYHAEPNNFEGKIPTYLFMNNTQLEDLYVGRNKNLNGSLPDLPANSSLKCLDIRDTGIHSPLPPSYLQLLEGELFLPASGFNISLIRQNILKYKNNDMKCQTCKCKVNVDYVDRHNNGVLSPEWKCDDLCNDNILYRERIGWRPVKGKEELLTDKLKFSEYIWCNSWPTLYRNDLNTEKWQRKCRDLPLS